ncbi:hypothetical protein F5Y09DRAFT_356292 [Xylaria sp. FL1042]|nr:hypothetical protein F5Y09DRAFT_356292 [Xylaria sp. FL1042]
MEFPEEMEVDTVMADDELFSDSDGINLEITEQGNEDETITILQPKTPFKERADALISFKHEKFQKVENYFSSLLSTSGLPIDSIIEGTFDDHEITLITPHAGPPDIVRWQMRNAQRYHENLETKFKGHTDTLAFKLACLYFGLPVEPLRSGTTSFLSLPDPGPLEKEVAPKPNPLKFLEQYSNEDEPVPREKILSLRGGGDFLLNEIDNIVTYNPTDPFFQSKGSTKRPTALDELAIDEVVRHSRRVIPDATPKIRLYGWQGAVDTTLRYGDFVSSVDKLISNWDKKDRLFYLDVFEAIPTSKYVETVRGALYHGEDKAWDVDAVWEALQKYFGDVDDCHYVCFVRPFTEGRARHPDRYKPTKTDKGVIEIENAENKDVAYMRVPSNIHMSHKPHQFSMEYMHAMQFHFLPHPPHASVTYQGGVDGEAYQYLDPPSELWEDFIAAESELDLPKKITFNLEQLDKESCQTVIPGVPWLHGDKVSRSGLREGKTDARRASDTLEGVYGVVQNSTLKEASSLRKECNGLEIWRRGTDFKDFRESPKRVTITRSTKSPKTLESWQEFLNTIPDNEPLCLVVRPVYKSYRLLSPDSKEEVSLQLNELDLQNFKAIVHNRLYEDYDPKNRLQVIVLGSANLGSYQAELTIRHNTTEDEWQWIRRNIIESELIVFIDDQNNGWKIPKNSTWGPRYIAQNYADNKSIPTETEIEPASHIRGAYAKQAVSVNNVGSDSGKSTPPIPESATISAWHTHHPVFASPGQPSGGNTIPIKRKEGTRTDAKRNSVLDYVFRNSKNTADEAERMRELRSRTFTSVSSIFTDPLKPVMPPYGLPLESVIKTGPSMPGVSIAMLTPTEVLRLQQEVHSLRFQLLDRTRECPYADCDRYFTFSDGEGLDRHIREDHNTLRCFLCDKNQHLLPHYNADQIKKHFVAEHLDEILRAYGGVAQIQKAKLANKKTKVVEIEEENPHGESQGAGGFSQSLPIVPVYNPFGTSNNSGQYIVDTTKVTRRLDGPSDAIDLKLPRTEEEQPKSADIIHNPFAPKSEQNVKSKPAEETPETVLPPIRDPSSSDPYLGVFAPKWKSRGKALKEKLSIPVPKPTPEQTTEETEVTTTPKTADDETGISTAVDTNLDTLEQNHELVSDQLTQDEADLEGDSAAEPSPEKTEDGGKEEGKAKAKVKAKGKAGGSKRKRNLFADDDLDPLSQLYEYSERSADSDEFTGQEKDGGKEKKKAKSSRRGGGGKRKRNPYDDEGLDPMSQLYEYSERSATSDEFPGEVKDGEKEKEGEKTKAGGGGKKQKKNPPADDGKQGEQGAKVRISGSDNKEKKNPSTPTKKEVKGERAGTASNTGSGRKKRKRNQFANDGQGDGPERYEWSEGSAVEDPPDNLEKNAPPSPKPKSAKKARKGTAKPKIVPPPPTPVTPARENSPTPQTPQAPRASRARSTPKTPSTPGGEAANAKVALVVPPWHLPSP